jgi:hypothetical protein
MAKIHQLSSDFWIDGYSSNLDPIEKLMFIYLLTGPHANMAGVYQVPIKNIAVETGIDRDMVQKVIDRFQAEGKILYKDGWVCVRNRGKFNKQDNDKIQKNVDRIIDKSPDFVKEFLNITSENDTVSIPYADPHINTSINISISKELGLCEKFVEKWNDRIKQDGIGGVKNEMPAIFKLTGERKKHLSARLAEACLEVDVIINRIFASDFLCGRTAKSNGHEKWKPNIDWIINPTNWAKLMEGNYDNKMQSVTSIPTVKKHRCEDAALTIDGVKYKENEYRMLKETYKNRGEAE